MYVLPPFSMPWTHLAPDTRSTQFAAFKTLATTALCTCGRRGLVRVRLSTECECVFGSSVQHVSSRPVINV